MNTILPAKDDLLFALGDEAVSGLKGLGATLGVTQNTEARLSADLKAAREANGALQDAMCARTEAAGGQASADAGGRAFIRLARDNFKSTLGTRYSQAWRPVGFKNNSLAIPGTLAGRLELVQAIGAYLAAHLNLEVPALQLTHQQAGLLHDNMLAAMTDMAGSWAAQRSKSTAKAKAVAALRARLRGLLHELAQLLAPDDPRWKDFGFNVPADDSTPLAPQELAVSDGAPGHLLATWLPVSKVYYYRLFKKVVGLDPAFVHVRNTTDTSVDLNTFVPGQRVELEVTAVNSAGESLPCPPVEHVVP